MLINFAVGALLFYLLKPTPKTEGAAVWGRYSAAWIALGSALNPTVGQHGIDAIAAWSVGVIIFPPIAYFIGIGAHYLFRGAKRAKAAVPGVIDLMSKKTSGITGHLRESMNPYDSSDADVYAAVATEMESSNLDRGLWTKALALADGNEQIATANYIKLRVNQIKNQRVSCQSK